MLGRPIGTESRPTGASGASSRGEGGFYRHFGTTTLNRSSSGAGSRVEGKEIGTLDGIMVGFKTGFGTAPPATGGSEASRRGEGVIYRLFDSATLPTDASVASSRSHCELVHRIVAVLCFVKFTWNEPLLIIK